MRLSVLLAAFSLALPLSGTTTIFSENFESYSAPVMLAGQGGWVDEGTGYGRAYVRIGSHLASQVLDGRYQNTPYGGIDFVIQSLPHALFPSLVTALSFDAYAVSDAPPSTNTGVYLGDIRHAGVAVGWAIDPSLGWYFASYSLGTGGNTMWNLTGAGYLASDSYDRAAHLGIVLDPLSGFFYGTYDLGSGVAGQTPHYGLSSNLSMIDRVSLVVDLQYPGEPRLGAELDNIFVSETPEPGSIWLTGTAAALLGLGARRRWRRRTE